MKPLNIKDKHNDYVLFDNNLYYNIERGTIEPDLPQPSGEFLDKVDFCSYQDCIPKLELIEINLMDPEVLHESIRFIKKNIDFLDTPYALINLNSIYDQRLLDYIITNLESTSSLFLWIGLENKNPLFTYSQKVLHESSHYFYYPQKIYFNIGEDTNLGRNLENIKTAIRQDNNYRTVIGLMNLQADFPAFDEIFFHIYEELGIYNIHLKPVSSEQNKSVGLSKETLTIFKEGYTRLVDFILSQSKEKMLAYLLAFEPDDFFMRFVYRIKDRSRQIYQCGAGRSGFCINKDGKLYPCKQLVGYYSMGNIYKGYDRKRKPFYRLSIKNRKPCENCWVRYLCGGGCYYRSMIANGNIDKPDPVNCDLIIHLCIEAIRLIQFLSINAQDVLTALPSPYYIHKGNLTRFPEEPFKPISKLIASTDKLEVYLTAPGRLKGVLSDNIPEIILKIEQQNEILELIFENGIQLENKAQIRLWFLDLSTEDAFFMYELPVVKPEFKGVLFLIDSMRRIFRLNQRNTKIITIPTKLDWEKTDKIFIDLDSTNRFRIKIPLKEVFGGKIPSHYGFNIFLEFLEGGRASLINDEPFCVVSTLELGSLKLNQTFTNLNSSSDCEPLTRWMGMKCNFCNG